jgi:exodeoxyribonuclease X
MKISEASWVIVDTETTGLDPAKERIVEFAYIGYEREWHRDAFLVNPGIPIPCITSAIHHITDEDVTKAQSWQQAMSAIPQRFETETVFVAHNATFDAGFLPCLSGRKWLCTKRLAMHLYPDAPGHSNQVLRYWLGGAKLDLLGQAPHRALADCIVTRFNFGKMIDKYLADGYEDSDVALIAFASSPIKAKALWFGKHKGVPIDQVPRDYIKWCLLNMADLDRDLRFQLEEMVKTPCIPR